VLAKIFSILTSIPKILDLVEYFKAKWRNYKANKWAKKTEEAEDAIKDAKKEPNQKEKSKKLRKAAFKVRDWFKFD